MSGSPRLTRLAASGELLKGFLAAEPAARLGSAVAAVFGPDLPFLLKALSVATALSIQAHPDKTLAARLHASRPDVYKDGNHKPEMALAATPFEVLVGFRSPADLAAAFADYPELAAAAGSTAAAVAAAANAPAGSETASAALRAAFAAVATLAPEAAGAAVEALVARLAGTVGTAGTVHDSARRELLLRLSAQYPRDVGVLLSLFLNHLTLPPGAAVALAANVPHAYLAGECFEVMATSDNVVRAGLTPKLRDVETLVPMLSYDQVPVTVLSGTVVSDGVREYRPPFAEFALDAVALAAAATAPLLPSPGLAILLVAAGGGELTVAGQTVAVAAGDAFALPPGCDAVLKAGAAGLSGVRARVNM